MITVSPPPAPTPFDPGSWGSIVSIDTIKKTRVPCRGPETWRPLPHGTFVEMIEQSFDRHGFTISEPVHYMGRARDNKKIEDMPEHGRFLSLYGISHPSLPHVEGINWEAGFGNSYDMTIAAGGGLGKRVQVCSNGQYMGATQGFKRKHTKGIDLDNEGLFHHVYDLVNRAVSGLVVQAETDAHRISRFKEIECSDTDARWTILEAAKQGVIGGAATMRVLEHWETPEHPEFKDRNVWSLENAFTSNDRGRNILTQADRFNRLGVIMNDRFGFAESANSPDVEHLAADF